MADDIRIARWDLVATAGTTQRLIFTASEALTSLAVYVGGTVTDVDDLTDATAYTGTLSTGSVANDTATVDVVVPTGSSVALRLVVDGATVAVGRLTPSTSGTASPDNTITLVADTRTYALTVGGTVVVSGGPGGGVTDHGALTGLADDDHTQYALADGTRGTFATTAQGALADTAVQPAALSGYQPIDSDLTAIAALTTTAFGRGLLALADAATGRTTLGVYSTGETDAAIAALVDAAPGTLDTLNELAAALGDDPNFATTITTALAGKQPLDSDLTAIAALTTTAYGRSLLEAVDAAALRTLAGVYSTAEVDTAISNATSAAVPKALVDAKGDLLAASAADTVARLAVGTDGQVLTADAAQALGVKWATPSASGSTPTPQAQPYDGSNYGLALPGFPLEGGAGTLGTNGNWTYYTPMILSQERTINQLIVNLNATGTGTAASLSIHSADANFNPTALVLDAGTIDISTTGIKTKTISQVLPAGRYVLRMQANGGGTYLCALYTPTWKDTMGSSDFIRAYVNTSGTYSATAPDPGLPINSFLLGNNAGYAFVLPRFTA